MSQVQACIDSFDALEAPYVSIIVDRIMEQEFPQAPSNALVPASVWLKHKREELTNLICGRDLQLRFRRAFMLLENDCKGFATPIEMHRISEEFREGVRRLIKALSDIPAAQPEPAVPISFAQVLGLSDETIEFIYQCGHRHYQGNEVAEAADIFHLLACLDFRRYNVWIAQGAAEQTLGRLEAAVKAYAMAMLANPKAPLPYLHSAECYLALGGQSQEARVCLESAWQCVLEQNDDEAQLVRQAVEELRAKVN